MNWNLEEAIFYYKKQGAPADQSAVIALLREVQQEYGGIPPHLLSPIAVGLGTKESLLNALIRRIPGLRLADSHLLELCGGPNCGRHTALAELAETLFQGKNVTIRYVPCMRMCGKGPNLRWDGKLCHKADEALLRELFSQL